MLRILAFHDYGLQQIAFVILSCLDGCSKLHESFTCLLLSGDHFQIMSFNARYIFSFRMSFDFLFHIHSKR